MNPTSRTRRVAGAAAWITAGAIGATAVTGLAFAAPASTGTPGSVAGASQGTDQAATGDRLRSQLRNLLHGELTVSGSTGPTTVNVQRGKVTSASATSVTVRSSDGFTTTYTVSSTTTVRRDRATVTADKLVVGDSAFVRADGSTATVVRALSPEAAEKLKGRIGQGGDRGAGPGGPSDGPGA